MLALPKPLPVMRRPRKRVQRRPKHPAKALKATADKLFSYLIRSRGACEECGARAFLQCAHGFSRFYRAVRWDESNAWCLCRGCHKHYTHRPIEWREWMERRLGADRYALLERQARHGRPPDVAGIILWLRSLPAVQRAEAAR